MKLFDMKQLGPMIPAVFHNRPNRFIGMISVNRIIKRCHVADTGRLEEILTENRQILVVKNREELKTDYTLVAAKMEDGWILVNTALHSKIVRLALEKGILGFVPTTIQSEVSFGNSRLDFLVDDNIFIEVKASNLLKENACLFPDAPTTRGKRHLEELIQAKKRGYQSIILLLGLRDCSCFSPNRIIDKKFSSTFEKALAAGVGYVGFKIRFNPSDNYLYYDSEMPLCMKLENEKR